MKDDLQKSDSCGLKSERKKILTSSTCSLACLSTNLGAFCPMVVHLPSEKSILPYFSGPRGVAISVPFPEVRNRKGAESGLPLPAVTSGDEGSTCSTSSRAQGPGKVLFKSSQVSSQVPRPTCFWKWVGATVCLFRGNFTLRHSSGEICA